MVAAILVLYYPNESLLKRLLTALSKQHCEVFVMDNTKYGAVSWLDESWFSNNSFSVKYIPLMDNLGIATAQNKGIEAAKLNGCSEFILFDQDSEPTANLITGLLAAHAELKSKGIKVASVGPLFIDEKDGQYAEAIRHGLFNVNRIPISPTESNPVEADYLIASGSMISIEVLEHVGLMRDDLFIDWVDIEWGLRAKGLGYKHFIIPTSIMMHAIGDDAILVAGRNRNLHSDIRNYYIVRNACYLLKVKSMGFRWRLITLIKIPQYVIFYSITSKCKIKSLFLLMKACVKGFSSKLGRAF